ncbi:hypothetical protein FGO68_gene9794 [Halteria grandinella]|uniref:Uncharacterized protein n=1 Tax=Halteria grandinella TaxID=5974 RepID=A0A8J8SZM0_HALGN|nr:hypothetical protein FGO68_gene9794 [Halteria grandinella]
MIGFKQYKLIGFCQIIQTMNQTEEEAIMYRMMELQLQEAQQELERPPKKEGAVDKEAAKKQAKDEAKMKKKADKEKRREDRKAKDEERKEMGAKKQGAGAAEAGEEDETHQKGGKVFLKQRKDAVVEIMKLGFAQIGQCMVTLWHRPTEQHIARLKSLQGITFVVTLQSDREHPESITSTSMVPMLQSLVTRKLKPSYPQRYLSYTASYSSRGKVLKTLSISANLDICDASSSTVLRASIELVLSLIHY